MNFNQKVSKYKKEIDIEINPEILPKKNELFNLVDDYIIPDVCNIVWDYYNECVKCGGEMSYGDNGNSDGYGYMINFKKHGKWIYWNSFGNKYLEIGYINGLFHGKYTSWHSNGTICCDGQYRNGLYVGIWSYFNTDSIKMSEIDCGEGIRNWI